MIVDCHTHIFPKSVRECRETYFAGEPAFELLYRSPKAKLAGAGGLVETMDRNAVEKSIVFGFPWKTLDTVKRHNDYIAKAVQRYPDRLIGLCCLDPLHPEAQAEAKRCLAAGFRGLGELAFYRSGIDEDALRSLAPMMELCRNEKIPVMIHTNEPVGHHYPGKSPNTLSQILRLVQTFADNTVILAHWGGGLFFFNLLKKELKESLANVYFDTAASPFLYDSGIYRTAISIIGAEKIIFGSDFPLLNPARYVNEMRDAGLSAQEIAAICGLNARKLFGI
jgi:predicted TIM-barrel fold metal-dependent hydrolase